MGKKNTHYPIARKLADGTIDFAGIFCGDWESQVKPLGGTILKGAKSYEAACANVQNEQDRHKRGLFSFPIPLYRYDATQGRFVPQGAQPAAGRPRLDPAAFIEIIKTGDSARVKTHLDTYQVDVNALVDGRTALHIACERVRTESDLKIVQLLLESGADVALRDQRRANFNPPQCLLPSQFFSNFIPAFSVAELQVRLRAVKLFSDYSTAVLSLRFGEGDALQEISFSKRPSNFYIPPEVQPILDKKKAEGYVLCHKKSVLSANDEVEAEFLGKSCQTIIDEIQASDVVPENVITMSDPYQCGANRLTALWFLDAYYRRFLTKDNVFVDTEEANAAFGFLSGQVTEFRKTGRVGLVPIPREHNFYLRHLPTTCILNNVSGGCFLVVEDNTIDEIQRLSDSHFNYHSAFQFLAEQLEAYDEEEEQDGMGFVLKDIPQEHLPYFNNYAVSKTPFFERENDTHWRVILNGETIEALREFLKPYKPLTHKELEEIRKAAVRARPGKRIAEEALTVEEDGAPPTQRYCPDPGSTSSSVLASVSSSASVRHAMASTSSVEQVQQPSP